MQSDPITLALNQALRNHCAEADSLCVALSGGMDSVVLLDALARLQSGHNFSLSAVHVNHGLSANADSWARFCESLCKAKNIPLKITEVRVDRASSGGVESAARARRYAAFAEIEAHCLLLAHHADDQAETVLHRLLRGSGITGLAGMSEVRPLNATTKILRPLLAIGREALFAYAQSNALDWIEDESNNDTTFTRNFIRHELNPAIAKRFPHYRESLNRISSHAREHSEFAEALATLDLQWNKHIAHADLLDNLPLARQVNALYHWLRWNHFTSTSHDELATWAAQLFRPATPGKPQRAGGHEVIIWRRKNMLTLETIKPQITR